VIYVEDGSLAHYASIQYNLDSIVHSLRKYSNIISMCVSVAREYILLQQGIKIIIKKNKKNFWTKNQFLASIINRIFRILINLFISV